jgi:cellulose synthase (UDP-forming)
MRFTSENRVLPVISDLSGLLSAFVITRAVWVSFTSPFGHAFKVTAKGISTTGVVVLWTLLWRYAALALLTVAGIVLNLAKYGPGHGTDGYRLNLLWSFVNLGVLALACTVCVEMPKRRCDQRFQTSEEGMVRFEQRGDFVSQLKDISVSGACLCRQEGWEGCGSNGVLVLDGGRFAIPFRVVRRSGERIGVSFEASQGLRRALIGKLFSGAYHQDVGPVRPIEVFGGLVRGITA